MNIPPKKELMNRSLSTITINIGKSGVNESVIEEIKRQLKAHADKIGVKIIKHQKGADPAAVAFDAVAHEHPYRCRGSVENCHTVVLYHPPEPSRIRIVRGSLVKQGSNAHEGSWTRPH